MPVTGTPPISTTTSAQEHSIPFTKGMPLFIALAIAFRVWGYGYTVFAKPIFILTCRITGTATFLSTMSTVLLAATSWSGSISAL